VFLELGADDGSCDHNTLVSSRSGTIGPTAAKFGKPEAESDFSGDLFRSFCSGGIVGWRKWMQDNPNHQAYLLAEIFSMDLDMAKKALEQSKQVFGAWILFKTFGILFRSIAVVGF
jgi:hypothetical protein